MVLDCLFLFCTSVHMGVETLKEAWLMGWRVRVKCDTIDHWKEAYRDPALSCHSSHELDMKSLVWTRGAMPIKDLKERLRCPACGSRHILIFFEIPTSPRRSPLRTHIDIEDYLDDSGTGTV